MRVALQALESLDWIWAADVGSCMSVEGRGVGGV